jgi:hypothetical protein
MVVATSHQVFASELAETLCNRLWQFRLGLEGQAGESITVLDAPVALVLSDLCRFLHLSEEQHARVLGEEGVAYVDEVLETRVRKVTSGRQEAARQ